MISQLNRRLYKCGDVQICTDQRKVPVKIRDKNCQYLSLQLDDKHDNLLVLN